MSSFLSRLVGARPSAARAAPAAPTGPSLAEWLAADHAACDALWADAERSAQGDPAGFAAALATFDGRLRRHLAMEEEVLFPAFDERSGMGGLGPTSVMRGEHAQMRGVLDQMAGADPDDAVALGDTLMMLIQQHNAKEEGMLYPMAEQLLGPDGAVVLAAMSAY